MVVIPGREPMGERTRNLDMFWFPDEHVQIPRHSNWSG
jgi:hypothetical protein